MRQFTIGLLNKTDGSAKLVNGDTVVIASVVGPKETTNDSTSAQVVVKWSSEGDVRDETDAERKRIIQKVIESLIVKSAYPRTVTRIGVTVLRDNGSLLSTAINAVMMALVDSGIMMNGLATASTCAVLEDGESGRVIPNPTKDEEASSLGSIFSVWHSTTFEVLSTISRGNCGTSTDQYMKVLEAGRQASNEALAFLRLSYDNACKSMRRG
jgi:ribonuclease PH|eukprot:g5006.t1